jgi:hypothetical protein
MMCGCFGEKRRHRQMTRSDLSPERSKVGSMRNSATRRFARRVRARACAAALLSNLILVPSLHADTIRADQLLAITAGSYHGSLVNDDREIFFTGAGRDFSFNIFAAPGVTGGTLIYDRGRVPFTIDPSLIGSVPAFGTLRVGTRVFETDDMGLSPFRLDVRFNVSLQHWSPPAESGGRAGLEPFPFSFLGSLAGRGPDGAAFLFDFTGGGQGTSVYAGLPDDDTNLTRIDAGFVFEPGAPTPEPPTIVLLVGACIACLRRYTWTRGHLE